MTITTPLLLEDKSEATQYDRAQERLHQEIVRGILGDHLTAQVNALVEAQRAPVDPANPWGQSSLVPFARIYFQAEQLGLECDGQTRRFRGKGGPK